MTLVEMLGLIFLFFGINVGALVSPIVVGQLGFNVNFHLGFSLAAIGMFFGLLQYWLDGRKYLSKDSLYPTDPIESDELKGLLTKTVIGIAAIALILIIMNLLNALNITNIINLISIIAVLIPIYYFVLMLSSRKITKVERSRVLAYIPLFIASVLFWSIEEQGSVVLALFAGEQTRLSLFGFHFAPSLFQSMNPLFIIIYVPFFAWLWVKLGSKQPSSPMKFSIGLFFAGLSFMWMMLPGMLFGTDKLVSPFWLIISWALVIIGEMNISPIGLSVTTKLAPKAFQSQMMSMWFLGDAAAQAINAQIVKLYSHGTEVMYYGVVGAITIAFGIILLFFVPKIEKLMSGVL